MTSNVTDINEFALKNFIELIRPDDPEVRKQLDIGYSYDGKVALLFEIRPMWNDPKKILNLEFAKISYIKSKKIWKLYWKRASGKWELYQDFPESTHLGELLDIIKEDENGCFFG